MSDVSIIGLENMARVLGGLALAGGNTVEVTGRDPAKAADLAGALGGATAGKFGAVPAGDVVILALPYAAPSRSSADTGCVAAFAESLALRPLDVGGPTMARWLEGAGLLEMRLAIGGAVQGSNFSPAINVLG